MTTAQRFQIVTLRFGDGSEISMLAPVFAETGSQLGSLRVIDIHVSPPQQLQEGYELTTAGLHTTPKEE